MPPRLAPFDRLRALWPDARTYIRPRLRVLALCVVLVSVSRLATLVLPLATRWLVDRIVTHQSLQMLDAVAALVLLAAIVDAGASYVVTLIIVREGLRIVEGFRLRVQERVGRLPLRFHVRQTVGAIQARVMVDVESVRHLMSIGLIDLASASVTALAALVALFVISPLMASLSMVILAGYAAITRHRMRFVHPIYHEKAQAYAEVTGRLTESLAGIQTVKCYHAEEREQAVFAKGVGGLTHLHLRLVRSAEAIGFAGTVATGLAAAMVLSLGVHQVQAGAMTLGELASFTMFLSLLSTPILRLSRIGSQVTEALTAIERAREILRELPEWPSPERTRAIGPIAGRVEFDHVTFAYEAGSPVLFDVSFVAEPNTVTAFVGPSGAGKSTIAGLIASLWSPTAGTVFVDGVDLSTVTIGSYRTQLGVVTQETFLFQGTIYDNVAYSRPAATRAEVLRACQLAGVDEFAATCEHNYDAVVGERGVRLSVGQKQRVSIARAILANPRILILDEATASLDSATEERIQKALDFLVRGRTTFVIAHRLSTIRDADQVLVIDRGRVVESGPPARLYAQGRHYYELCVKQQQLSPWSPTDNVSHAVQR